EDRADVPRRAEGVPRLVVAGHRRLLGGRRDGTARAEGDRHAEDARARVRRDEEADPHLDQPRAHGGEGRHPTRRQRQRRSLHARALGAARPDHGAGHRRDGGRRRLQHDEPHARTARLRVRARARIPAPAAHVQVDRHPDQGDRAQPALGRRRVRRARLDLPGRPHAVAARLSLERRDRDVAAALPLHRAVRPVHGLPRLHPQPHQGARRRRHAHGGGGGKGHPDDRRHGDERSARDGRRVRHLRVAVGARHEADGRRPRGRGPSRRDDRPRSAAARDDEAPRSLELVPAAQPALATADARAVRGGSVIRRTLKTLLFLLAVIPLGGIGLAALIAGWVLVGTLAVTPLAVPALVAFRVAIGGVARLDATLANRLLGASVQPVATSPGPSGFWNSGLNVLRDTAFWRQQVYVALRLSLGFGLAVAEWSLVAASLGLVSLPIWYRWTDVQVGPGWHVRTLGHALLCVPVGLA